VAGRDLVPVRWQTYNPPPMSLVPDRCICLRKVEYSETSQILLLFGRGHGLVRVIAKGAHRVSKQGASKFGGGIDLLDVGMAVFTDRPEKDLATLTEWKLQEGHLDLRRSLRGVNLAFYAAELVGLLIHEHDPHPDLFDQLETVIPLLSTRNAEQAFLSFELDLLRETGYLPELAACVECGSAFNGRQGAIGFSADRGGALCRDCEGAFPERSSLDARLIGMMNHLVTLRRGNGHGRMPSLTRHQTDPINRLLAEHVQYTLQRRLRVAKYVM
jgi:DNA repair protein RecO (recombination protein O)